MQGALPLAGPGGEGDHRGEIEGGGMVGREPRIGGGTVVDRGAIEPKAAEMDRGRGDVGGLVDVGGRLMESMKISRLTSRTLCNKHHQQV